MDSCLPTKPSKSAPRVYYHLEESASKATKEETVKKEKEKEGSGGGGSIKDSTLRYNKVHPRKPSARPAPFALLRLAAAALRHSTYFVPQLY